MSSIVTGNIECPYCRNQIGVSTKINERVFYHICSVPECGARMVIDLRHVFGDFAAQAIEGERDAAEDRQRQLRLLDEVRSGDTGDLWGSTDSSEDGDDEAS